MKKLSLRVVTALAGVVLVLGSIGVPDRADAKRPCEKRYSPGTTTTTTLHHTRVVKSCQVEDDASGHNDWLSDEIIDAYCYTEEDTGSLYPEQDTGFCDLPSGIHLPDHTHDGPMQCRGATFYPCDPGYTDNLYGVVGGDCTKTVATTTYPPCNSNEYREGSYCIKRSPDCPSGPEI